jgi:hypothetical protein
MGTDGGPERAIKAAARERPLGARATADVGAAARAALHRIWLDAPRGQHQAA